MDNELTSDSNAQGADQAPKTKRASGSRSTKPRSSRKAPPPPINYWSREGAQMAAQNAWSESSRVLKRSQKSVKKAANNVKKDIRKGVRKNPIQTLAASLGIGLIFGAVVGIFFSPVRFSKLTTREDI